MLIRTAILTSGVILLAGLAVASDRGTLVYVREAGCPYCRLWDTRIAPIYPPSLEGQRATLRVVDIRDIAASGLPLARPVRVTPTFVLIARGREIGRIEGYPGEDFFWGLLGRLIEKLDRASSMDATPVARTADHDAGGGEARDEAR